MQRGIKLIIILILFFAAFLTWQAVFATTKQPFLEVIFFDVGEGDSILIEMPGQNQVLIDGGPSGDVVEKIAGEMPFFDREIEMVILTHPDKDHIGGLFEVLESFKINKILMPEVIGEKREKELYVSFKKLAKEKNIEIVWAKEGQKISFLPADLSSTVLAEKEALAKEDSVIPQFFILWPKDNFESKDTNDFSIVAKLSFGNIDFLLTGDAPTKIEHRLLGRNFELEHIEGFNLESEVLKIGHHGSKYSTNEYFLEKVSPITAVISVGKNSYGHPAGEVLNLLSKYDIETLRTDKNGDIKIISDGRGYQVVTEK